MKKSMTMTLLAATLMVSWSCGDSKEDGGLCGNGKLDPGETCDGDCPDSCNEGDVCSTAVLEGSAADCTAHCVYTPITECIDGDGCCASGCDATNDSDCADEGFALRLDGGLEAGTKTFGGKEFVPLLDYLAVGQSFNTSDGLGTPIVGTPYDELYQTQTFLPNTGTGATFVFPLDNGDYTVHLHFAEWVSHVQPGERVFSVSLQGQQVIDDLDVVAEVGMDRALVESYDVSVDNNELRLTISNTEGYPTISAVEILSPGAPYLGQEPLQLVTENLPTGRLGDSYSAVVDYSGGVYPYQWSVQDGALPGGLSLDSERGEITGTPSESGSFSFTIRIQDENSHSADKELSIVVEDASTGDVIEPTLQDIWDDSNVPFSEIPDPAVPEGLSSSYDMYYAPIVRDFPAMNVEWTDPWYVVAREAPVTSEGCDLGTGTSVNTAVEIGTIRNWWLLADGTWYLAFEDKNNDGYNFPNPNDAFPGDLGCPDIDLNVRHQHDSYEVRLGLSPDGFRLSLPDFAYWDHGWPTQSIKNIQDEVGQPVVAQLTQVFARLVKLDPNGVDDRHLARFVINVGADKRTGPPEYGVYGDVGYSVTKRITTKWTATHMLTGGYFTSYEDFVASNPPLNTVP